MVEDNVASLYEYRLKLKKDIIRKVNFIKTNRKDCIMEIFEIKEQGINLVQDFNKLNDISELQKKIMY